MMEKTFDPAAVESRIAAVWEEAQAFKSGRPERADAEPYSIVIPPPNVTGSLHMGHALNNILQDILARFERMRGKDVLWQPGMDHAGIATQMVVERQLMERQEPGRREMGREAFLKRVWEWKAESGGMIINQLKRLGASCDWSRERFTMDEGLSRSVVKVFVELYREGLIYKDKRLVNWDPKLLTAISDLEVEQIEVKGSYAWAEGQVDKEGNPVAFDADKLGKALAKEPGGHMYFFRYPLDGVAFDAGNPETFIAVGTTRPETMLGDTAVAVHPDHPKYGSWIGRMVALPLTDRKIPIVGDDYADPEKGTGAVKITPAHDFNDFEVGRRHADKLVDPINILDEHACLNENVPEPYKGMDRFVARKAIVEAMHALGLLEKIEINTHTVPHGDRSGVVVEPFLTDQWYVNAGELAKEALAAVRDGRTKFIPKNWEKTYFDWLENIQPWCVSRQLWWGHQIPAWYGPDGEVFVAESENFALGEAQRHYGSRVSLTRDEDVLDTWFSSALWPFSTLGWPDEDDPALKRFYPTSVLVTGFDIIFFWVARMMMMGLHFRKEIPFHDVYIHALVRDEKGAKMSKSKGNVIDPLALIDQYGADALRFTLAAMAAQGRDIKLATSRVEGYRSFATKLWNASRFAEINGCVRTAGFDPKALKETLNKWIVGELARAAAETSAAIVSYRFNDAANAAYRFVWHIFCDWYVELTKPVVQGTDSAAKDETRATTAYVIDEICKLLHPFMPFITEELWAIKGREGPARETILALASWPELAGIEDASAEAEVGFFVDLVSEIRSVRSEMNVPGGTQMPLVLVGANDQVKGWAQKWDSMITRLARLSGISFADEAPPESAQMIVRGATVALPLSGVVDLAAEKARLAKEIGKDEGEIKKIDAKLGNEAFIAKAPEEVVEENRERRVDLLLRVDKLKAALERLG